MRLRERLGWPPEEFRWTKNPSMPAGDRRPEVLRIESARYVGGHPGLKTPGDMVLTLVDGERGESCTARWKIPDEEVARQIQRTLMSCKGLTLAEAGLMEIHDDGQSESLQPPADNP